MRAATGATWTPLSYLSPFADQRGGPFEVLPQWAATALAFWTVPFLWIGLAMTMRRAVDAGWNPWSALLFFAPLVNYALILALACAPPRPRQRSPRPGVPASTVLRAVLEGLFASMLVGAPIFLLTVYWLREYTAALFLGLPFLIGALAARVYNRGVRRSLRGSIGVAWLAVLVGCGALLLFALEGLVCVLLALPVLLALACLGAVFGRVLAAGERALASEAGVLSLCLPLLFGAEHLTFLPREFEVVTALEIDAPPERVWRNVIGFTPLAPPTELAFALGIAYPTGARIEGEGVGAVRHCEFSTGEFLEPITAWEAPTRLAFDVARQPDPMDEWTPYDSIRPPHLTRAFRALRGEFRLVALPGDRTRLEGSTWYALELFPSAYWRWITDGIVHRIHGRVLEHVRALSEES